MLRQQPRFSLLRLLYADCHTYTVDSYNVEARSKLSIVRNLDRTDREDLEVIATIYFHITVFYVYRSDLFIIGGHVFDGIVTFTFGAKQSKVICREPVSGECFSFANCRVASYTDFQRTSFSFDSGKSDPVPTIPLAAIGFIDIRAYFCIFPDATSYITVNSDFLCVECFSFCEKIYAFTTGTTCTFQDIGTVGYYNRLFSCIKKSSFYITVSIQIVIATITGIILSVTCIVTV